jgi:hypothetical protein
MVGLDAALIGLHDRDRSWVLENPSRLFALDALLAAYPDAVVIQTHRCSSYMLGWGRR